MPTVAQYASREARDAARKAREAARKEAFIEDYEHFRAYGWNRLQLAARFRCKPDALDKRIIRYGLQPPLTREES